MVRVKDSPDKVGSSEIAGYVRRKESSGYMVEKRKVGGIVQSGGRGLSKDTRVNHDLVDFKDDIEKHLPGTMNNTMSASLAAHF